MTGDQTQWAACYYIYDGLVLVRCWVAQAAGSLHEGLLLLLLEEEDFDHEVVSWRANKSTR